MQPMSGTRNLLAFGKEISKILKTQSFYSTALSSEAIIEKEKRYSALYYTPTPVALVRGQGVFVWDAEGKRYFDFLSGYAVNSFGHCHPRIAKALNEQSLILHHTSRAYCTDVFADYAEKITKYFGFDKVMPMNTGVEADEISLKIARKWGYKTKKIPNDQAKIIFATGNFWGRSLAACSSSTDPSCYEGYGPRMPGFIHVPYDDLEALEEALKDPTVCSFIVEPIQGEAGVLVPKDGYLKGVRELCTKYNVLWIDDEVQTGMGRSGKKLAVDYDGVKPDILVLAKALGGGYTPISACLANDDVMSSIEPGTHCSTFGGNALSSRIGMTCLDILEEENLVENCFKMGELFRSELRKRFDKEAVLEVRGRGLMNAIVLNTKYSNAWDVCMKLKDNGLLTEDMGDELIRFAPPLIINREQMEESIDIIVKTLNGICSVELKQENAAFIRNQEIFVIGKEISNVLKTRASYSTALNSEAIMEREKRYVAQYYSPVPVALVKGQGVFVWDAEGKRYFDFLSGYAANSFGHCHPRIAKAIHEQSSMLTHTSRAFHTDVFPEYAEKVTKFFGFDKVLPMNTGVEADDTS
ncbi:hypothetical protein JTB14_021128 [Gonioctena quinquepunctata]|nr:hypothetical protein JTB14_021128 [Gonioctena quinquepunctata]